MTRLPGWHVSPGPEFCSGSIKRGHPPHEIAPRRPFYVTAGAVYRCEQCTEAPLDFYAITQAEQELARAERLARAAADRAAGLAPAGAAVDVPQLIADVHRLVAQGKPPARPVQRIQRPRPPIPYPQLDPLPFDPKAAALGDD